jgi:peptidoglycan/LPS O-acetylase OafA/YrhL
MAALQVLVYHAYPHDRGPLWLRPLIGSGYVGVGLFFVLSGFILSYNYEDALRAGGVSWVAFWRARFARIYPVYLLGLLVAIPPFFLYERGPADVVRRLGMNVVASLFMLQSWSPRTACGVNCPGWSLSVEALFYLVFPAVALLMLRVPRRRLPGVAAIASGVALLLPLLYLALRPDGHGALGPMAGGPWLMRLKYHPLSRLGEFVLGMAAGSIFLRREPPAMERRWLEAVPIAGIVCALAASATIPYPLMHNGLLAPLFALLVYRLAVGAGPLARILAGRIWERLGAASYAMYIFHVPTGNWLALAYRGLGYEPGAEAALLLMTAASLAVALLVFRYVEEPARKWLRKGGRTRAMPVRETAALESIAAGAD